MEYSSQLSRSATSSTVDTNSDSKSTYLVWKEKRNTSGVVVGIVVQSFLLWCTLLVETNSTGVENLLQKGDFFETSVDSGC